MWPLLLDMTHDDSKRMLRRLELEAYSSLISAFRAQGDLTKEKKKMLQDLQYYLSISTERHRAEVRRAINDEKLCTVADYISGPNTMSEWLIEGRRLIPLMPRLVPQTAFTAKANEAANMQAEKNASMPVPSLTGNKDLSVSTSPTQPMTTNNIVTKASRPTSPNSNVVVLPSGMSIHIKGGLNTEDEDEAPERKRRRSHSAESLVSPSASTQTPRVSYTTTAPSPVTGASPMKITISKSPRSMATTTSAQSQKVILVSSGQSSPNVLQKSITVPVVKTSASMTGSNKASIILPNTTSTVTTPNITAPGTSVTSSTMTFLTPTVSIPRPRVKTFPRQRFPNVQQGVQKPGVVIPMGPQPVHPSPQSVQNIHIKPVNKGTSSVQIRQEGGMKIISAGGSGKLLPKVSQSTTSSGTPVVVVSAGSSLSSTSNVTMVTRPITSIGQSGAKILNITTQGGKIISTGTGRNPNVVTVNPKTLQLHAVKTPGSKHGGKPNVIVVQKTQPRRPTSTISSTSKTTTIKSSAFEKELVNFLQRQDSTKHIVVSTPSGQRTIERKVIVTTPGQLEATRQRIRMEAEAKNNTILADLIKAAGIQEGEGGGDVTINLDEATMAALTGSSQTTETPVSRVVTSQTLPNNEWFEYDDGNQAYAGQGIDNQAIQAIIDSQPSTSQDKPKVTVQRASSIDLSQLNVDQLSQQQYYTIEQAMRMLNQPDKSADGVSVLRLDSQESDNSQSGEVETTVIQEDIPGAAIQVTNQNSQAELEQIAQRLNLQGELDPQTGIFYNTNSTGDNSDNLTQSQIVVTSGGKTFDLLSSSLEQAQINLDSYQFLEEDILTEKVTTETVGQPGAEIVEVSSTPHEVYTASPSEPVGQATVIVSSSNEGSHMGPMIRIKSGTSSSFIPIQEISKSSTINITTHQQPSTSVVHEAVLSQEEGMYTAEIIDDSNINQTKDTTYIASSSNEVPVTVETSSGDSVEVEGDIIGFEEIGGTSGVESADYYSMDPNVRLSKRKRRPPNALEDSPTSQSIGWSKSCLWLTQRVSKYRGLSRDKGEMNAASWFLKPVDPNDAPDYYSIIKNPMDFGTIKRKLEMNSYSHYEDFHSDMLLVRDNCRTYNPPGSVVRRDCDEVFAFYMSEYEKLLEKWQKVQFPSPASKKLKFDSRSPVK